MAIDSFARWEAAMLEGDFESAWLITDELERHRRQNSFRQVWNLFWDGTPVDNRDVVVRCRHGLGDSIQFLRYLPLLRARARSVRIDIQPELAELFPQRLGLFGRPEVEIEVMELPYVFRTSVSTLPRRVPYPGLMESISLEPELTHSDTTVLNVGLVWASGCWNPHRSIPPELLNGLAGVTGVRFYSLQQGPSASETHTLPLPVVPLNRRTRRITAAAAAMLRLDLIITVDSMPAHLAGALRRSVWTLLPFHADWRWMRGERTPWYPTMRLLRQPVPGAWEPVLDRVASDLKILVSQYRNQSSQRMLVGGF